MSGHSLDSISISQIMTSPVKTAKDTDTVRQVCIEMIKHHIGSVVIVKAETNSQEGTGIITERDIVRHIAEKPISFEAPAVQLMTQPLITMHAGGSLADALRTMQRKDIRRIVIIDANNKMIGIITDKDIFRFIANNESVASAFVNEELLSLNRSMIAERLSTNTLHDLIQKRA